MNDAFSMRRIEGVGDLDGEGQELLDIERPAGDAMLQRQAVEALHHHKGAVVFLANVVDGANVRMIQGGGRFGFAAKTFERLRITGDLFGKKLESDEAIEASILRFVDNAHTSTTEPLDNAIVRDGLADERGVGHWFFENAR